MRRADTSRARPAPQYDGQHVVFRCPENYDLLLVDAAVRDSDFRLSWVPQSDEAKVQAALAGFHAIPAGGVADPYVRTSVLAQYAANLAVRKLHNGPLQADALDDIRQLLLVENQGRRAIPFAIEARLERDYPYLAQLEHMLAIGSRLQAQPLGGATALPRATLGLLEDLREGCDPSGGMFTTLEQLEALIQQFPILQKVDLQPCEPVELAFAYASDGHRLF